VWLVNGTGMPRRGQEVMCTINTKTLVAPR
jgi:hypothetical protein